MNDRKSFILYIDTWKQWKKLDLKQRGELITAIYEYVISGEEKPLDDIRVDQSFGFIQEQIDRDSEKYRQTCNRRKESATKRWNDIKNDANTCKCMQMDAIDTVNDNVNDTVNDNDINNISKKFVKPTTEQVQEYCNERKNNVDAIAFVSYYESIGWKVGKHSMKDWKKAVITWEQNKKKSSNKEANSIIYNPSIIPDDAF